MSNIIQKRILLSQKGVNALKGNRNIDKERLFDMFTVAKEATIDALIVSNRIDLLPDYRRFQRIGRNALVSSEEIVEISGIEPGAQLGKIILTIKKAHFTGKIASIKQALSMIKAIVEAEDAPKSQKTLCSGHN